MTPFPIATSRSPANSLRRSAGQPLRLLVSVRDAEEARVAAAAGVEVIDVKEPSRGALGRADDATLREVAEAVQGSAILSFAAGEAIERTGDPESAERVSSYDFRGYTLFKFGPAGLAHCADWREALTEAWRSTAANVTPIAVAYVDYDAAGAPPPEAIVELAIERGCFGILFDTFAKAPRLGLTALPQTRLRSCIAQAHDAGLLVSLAGSLGVDDVASVRELGADVIAVRGAACIGARTSRIDATRLAALKEAIAQDAASSVDFDAEANEACSKDRA